MNSASNMGSRAVWKNRISLEGLTSVFYLINRCHQVLKSQQDLFINKQTLYKVNHLARAHGKGKRRTVHVP